MYSSIYNLCCKWSDRIKNVFNIIYHCLLIYLNLVVLQILENKSICACVYHWDDLYNTVWGWQESRGKLTLHLIFNFSLFYVMMWRILVSVTVLILFACGGRNCCTISLWNYTFFSYLYHWNSESDSSW